jgi:hypothetical protein
MDLTLSVEDNTNFVESVALVDKYIYNHPEESIFPIYDDYIHNYLQLFIDLRNEEIYEDVAVNAYAPNENGQMTKFNPVGADIYFNLHPNTKIFLQPDAGC